MSLLRNRDKIFVAGHNGMVGSSICKLITNKCATKENFDISILTADRKELDLTDNQSVKYWFLKNKPDIVIIAAAKVGGIHANSDKPLDFLLQNLKIEMTLIENAFLNGVRRLLFLGSSCIYPKFAKQPIREEELLSGYLEPTNEWYAIAKIAGIKLCEAYRKQYNFDAISLMPTNLYGPGDNYDLNNSHVLPALIRKFYTAKEESRKKVFCWGTGKPKREFLHVDDLSEACFFALENWDPNLPDAPKDNQGRKLSFLNVGTGKDISISNLASKIANLVGYKGEIVWDDTKPDGTPKKQLDVSRLSDLGWQSKIDLEVGLKKTIFEFEKIKNNL